MHPIIMLIDTLLGLLNFAIIAYVIVNLLVQFNIVNSYNPLVKKIYDFLSALINPILKIIRKYVPSFSGIDLSPLILIVFIMFVRYSLDYYF